MKKKVLSIAVIATSLFAFTGNAQNPENCPRQQCPAADCAEGVHHHKNRKPEACCNPFEGIELTEAQKAKIEEMRKNNREAVKQKVEERRKNREETRAKRDSLIRSGKLNQLRQLKEILTPEQYVTYLENIAVSQSSPRPRMEFGTGKPGKPGEFKKPGRDDRRGHKPPKGTDDKKNYEVK